MKTIAHRVVRDPYVLHYPDGSIIGMEHDETSVHDVRDTIFGPIDFGYVRIGPYRSVIVKKPPKKRETALSSLRAIARKLKSR